MKKYLIPILACAGIFMTGCSSSDEPQTQPEKKRLEITLTPGESETLKSLNSFAFDLFKAVNVEKRNQQELQKGYNYLISPFGASMALGMLSNGTRGETLSEITNMLKVGDGSLDDLNQFSRTMINAFTAPENLLNIKLENSLHSSFYTFNPDYLAKTGEFYNPKVSDKGYSSDITELEIVNSFEFQGTWVNVFNKERTEPGIFSNGDATEGMAYFMNSNEICRVSEDEICRIVSKPMDEGSFSVEFIIPEEGYSIDDVIEALTDEYWASKLYNLKPCQVELRIPKFSMEEDETDLVYPAKSLGMKKAFENGEAEIDGILLNNDNTPKNVIVSLFKQTSSITIDEEGAYIKVVTLIGYDVAMRPSEKRQFILDRPFIYVISETSTGAILFMGKVSRFKDFELY